jgi:hypothetical protein
MDYNLIVELLNKQITEKAGLQIGLTSLNLFLFDNFGISIKEDISIDRLDKEFQEGVISILSKNPIPKNISSLYFGLLTILDNNGNEKTAIHIKGSKNSPDQDSEWACDTDYEGGNKFLELTDFLIIDKKLNTDIEEKGAIEVTIFNGFLNLLIINSIDLIKEATFRSKGLFSKARTEVLWIGSGYDSGDCYLIGKTNK